MINSFKVPSEEISGRIDGIREKMRAAGMDAVFIAQRVDMFYYSGTAQSGFLYIPDRGEPLLFIKKFFPRARSESPIKNTVHISSIKDIPGLIRDFHGGLPKKLGLELDVLPVNDFRFYKKLFPKAETVDASALILEQRIIKSPWELEQMEKTATLSQKTFEQIKSIISPGISEMEFAGRIETYARRIGHGGALRTRHYQLEAYPWHILSGKSGGMVGMLDAPATGEGTSAASPAGAGGKLLSPGEPIMIDFVFVHNGYHTDETRMFAMDSMPQKAIDASKAAIEIQNAVLEKAKPGVMACDLFEYSVRIANSLGYEDSYLGPPGQKVTFIAHGIGLELIEPLFIAKNRKEMLRPGMAFALEPKIVFENEFSAGIESLFVVTEKGARMITKIPSDITIC